MASPVGDATGWCEACGNDLRGKSRFCDVCGSPVSARSATGEHKQVTVLFADVVGSMKLAATLDGERLQELMNELFNRAAAVVQRYQGTVDKFTGDGLMALFGAPVALENHALRACIAALEIQSRTANLASEVLRIDGVSLQLRIGLNSGEVIAGEIGSGPGRYTAVGHPVGMAQRVEAAAPPGGVLCSLSTARLVEDATQQGPVEEVAVKGTDELVPTRRLLAVESDRMLLGRSEGMLLGRDEELRSLRDLFDAARGGLVGIVGAPGVGKSRLIGEFTTIAASQGADVVVARCEAHTTTIAFGALSRLLQAMFSVEGLGDAAARIHAAAQCGGALTPGSADAQILFEAIGIADSTAPALEVSVDGRRRRLVDVTARAVRARSSRTVFVVEDTQWIDAPSDDVLAEFAATLDMTTSVFVTTHRPEFHGALHDNADQTIVLQPLTDTMAVRLVRQILGGEPSLAGLAERIAVVAVGNPFFVEEIVRDLAGRNVLSGSRGAYRLTGEVDEIGVPATVQAVLAARIDRLPVATKSILNAAAVIGSQFDIDALQALRPEVASAQLAELVSAELIDQTEFVPRQRYCFSHPLVRTVAYESQLSANRVEAHRKLAAAIAARNPDDADEQATLIATHLEAAGQLAEAYHWHMRAADWLRPRDLPAARLQWERARDIADRLPDDGAAITIRIAPRTMLTSTAFFVGEAVDADEHYRELRDLTMQAGDLKSLAIGTAGRIWSFTVGDYRVPEAAVLASELEELINGMECDTATLSIVLNAVAFARFANCEFDAALDAIDAIRALPHELPVEERISADALGGFLETCLGNVEQGRRRLRDATDQARGLTSVRYAYVLIYWAMAAALGVYHSDELIGETPVALRRAESSGDIAGITVAQWAYGAVLLRARNGSRDEAIDVLRRANATIQKHKAMTIALASVRTDLAMDAAHKGQRAESIDQLRAMASLIMDGGSRVFLAFVNEALVELLIDRGADDDLAEAHRIVDEWQANRPGIPALDLWWLKSRALLAKAAGNSPDYAERTRQYLELCERMNARGRLSEARQMLDT
jgi:adenylate cyclase